MVTAMAYIQERPHKNGAVTYQVRWIEGGGRTGEKQSERFGDRGSAEQFRDLVNAHGQHWPHGWVSGRGFVEPETHPGDVPIADYANRYVDRLTGIEERTRDDYRREVRSVLWSVGAGRWPLPTIGVLAGVAGAATGIIAMLR